MVILCTSKNRMVIVKFHLHKICHTDLFQTKPSQNILCVNLCLESNKFPSKSYMKIQTDFQDNVSIYHYQVNQQFNCQ